MAAMELSWKMKLALGVVALIVSSIMVPTVASLTVKVIRYFRETIARVLAPLTLSGDARLEGLISLCLYLVIITLLVRFIIRK
jgi:hypothetical protein